MTLARRLELLAWAADGGRVDHRGRLRQRVPLRRPSGRRHAGARRGRAGDLRRHLQQDDVRGAARRPGSSCRPCSSTRSRRRCASRAMVWTRTCRPRSRISWARGTSPPTCGACAALYADRQARLVRALHRRLGDVLEVAPREGGMQLPAFLPAGVDDVAASQRRRSGGRHRGAALGCIIWKRRAGADSTSATPGCRSGRSPPASNVWPVRSNAVAILVAVAWCGPRC